MDDHINKTNKLHVVVGLFRNTSQKTLKCGKALFRSYHNHYNFLKCDWCTGCFIFH